MLGSWRWNAAIGAAGLLLTFLISMGNNGFAVSCLRGFYAGAALFLLAYPFRLVLFLIAGETRERLIEIEAEPDGLGGSINVTTPDESDDLNDLLRAQMDGGGPLQDVSEFRPLQPKKLVSAQNKDPEELAQVIRHLAEQRPDGVE